MLATCTQDLLLAGQAHLITEPLHQPLYSYFEMNLVKI